MKIDAHQHFWHYDVRQYSWINDEMAVLRNDFLPDHLKRFLDAGGLDGSVAVQARQSLDETRWLLSLADQHPHIKGVVGWVDLRSDNLDDQLGEFADHPKFVGVRHVVQDEPDNRFLLRADFMRGVEKLINYDLAYDILIFPKQLPAAFDFVKNFPKHRFVLDHIAKPFIKDGVMSPWDEQMHQLASFPNVFCKVSGMVTEADWQNCQISDFEPYLDVVFNAFGVDRLMFGSDWPVCTIAAAYDKVMEIVDFYLNRCNFSSEKKAAFWGGNAAKFYQLI